MAWGDAMPSRALPRQQQIDILLEEYRALYGLVQYRIASLERRVPVAGVAFTAVLGIANLLPDHVRFAFLVALPIVAVWFVHTTMNHVRSLEDLLRRIEAIERAVNKLAGKELLLFQSRHPSRGEFVGGRVGAGSANAVAYATLLLIGICATLFLGDPPHGSEFLIAYGTLLVLVVVGVLAMVHRVRGYRYRAG